MTHLVDIHTHRTLKEPEMGIRNLNFDDAEFTFRSEENGFFSTGIHPWNVHTCSNNDISKLEFWSNEHRLIAIGECGLDKYSTATLEMQKEVFEKQIRISEKAQKALIVHCVGFFNELLEIKKQLKPKQLWIIHGFRGKPQLARQLLKTDCALSFGEKFNPESVKITPLDKLYIETDESNQSIETIYNAVALAKGCDLRELSAGTHFLQSVKRLS